MNISQYISQLIENQDCVIIPGWGALLVQKISAEIHPITHKVLPPGKTIGFNKQVKVNDGLLSSHIATQEKITFFEANQQIQNWVQWVTTELNTQKKYSLAGVGRFYINDEGNVEFIPESRLISSSDVYGLPELMLKPIDRSTKPMENRRKTQTKKVVAESDQTTTASKSNVWKVMLFIAPVILLLGSGLIIMKQNPEMQIAGFSFSSVFGSDTTANLENSNEVKEIVLQTIDSVQQADSMVQLNDSPETMVTPSETSTIEENYGISKGSYAIVVGVFKEESNADQLVNKYTSLDPQKHTSETKGLHYVTIGSYTTKEEAKAKRLELVSELGESIWVKKF
ncbi:MAG: SPOR domain-containing protein [Cytophagaceae bacterium]|jgi:hypothetical protein|nr:SPOR domain-containing protein [Cytophagaceae bacterium]